MRELLYEYEEFKAKVDRSKPVHHRAVQKPLDKHGVFVSLVFQIYGLDRNNGHVLVFEAEKRASQADPETCRKAYREFAQKYAEPLGSTEGAWRP